MQTADLDNDLWAFLLAIYDLEGVQPACLALQQASRADIVTLLIWAYFLRPNQEPLGAESVQALQAHVAPWRDRTILPLRALRIDLRDGKGLPDPEREALRLKIKAVELGAERSQVTIMARWLAQRPPRSHEDPEKALPLILGPVYSKVALDVIRKAALSL